MAKKMVTVYGMSDALGMMAPASVQHQYLEGQAYMDCSQETSGIVDREVKSILENCYRDAVRVLTENRELLDEIAEYLLVKETITGEELMAFINPPVAEAPAEEIPAEQEPAAEVPVEESIPVEEATPQAPENTE